MPPELATDIRVQLSTVSAFNITPEERDATFNTLACAHEQKGEGVTIYSGLDPTGNLIVMVETMSQTVLISKQTT